MYYDVQGWVCVLQQQNGIPDILPVVYEVCAGVGRDFIDRQLILMGVCLRFYGY
jgi:hypothetical protein